MPLSQIGEIVTIFGYKMVTTISLKTVTTVSKETIVSLKRYLLKKFNDP